MVLVVLVRIRPRECFVRAPAFVTTATIKGLPPQCKTKQYKYTNTKIYKYMNIQIHKYTTRVLSAGAGGLCDHQYGLCDSVKVV